MRQTTSTTSTMTRTRTRARCTTPEHALRARSLRHTLMLGHMHLVGSSSESRHVIHVHVRLSLSSHLSLSTSICPSPSLSLFFLLMLFEQHTELDNLIAMQNLRTSANKGSNDAYHSFRSIFFTSFGANGISCPHVLALQIPKCATVAT